MDYLAHILVLIAVYATLAISLDLIAGHAGLLSMAQAAFAGLGAYTSALLAIALGMSFGTIILCSAAVAVLLSLGISLPSMRLHDDYFVIGTFAFQVIVFSVLNNWVDVTHGPLGIPGIPKPHLFGWTVDSRLEFLILACAVSATAFLAVTRIAASPFGRVLHGIREDELFVKSLGKNTLYFKTVAFAVSAALAACAGVLYAHYTTYIDPTSFTVAESILVISMVVIGGAASRWGPVIGAALLITLPEMLRFVGIPSAESANIRQIIYGALLTWMIVSRPQGLVGRYAFLRRTH